MTTDADNNGVATSATNEVLATVILPAYNETEALPSVLASLSAVLDSRYEILVVDDGSTDDTVNVARKGNCRVICHAQNMGKGAAVRTGVANARGERIIIMDADATYPADAIPKMVELLGTHDVVRCHRESRHEQMPTVNRLGNWFFDALLTRIHGLEGGDHLSGLYGMRMDAIHGMGLEADGFDIEAEIGIKARAQDLKLRSSQSRTAQGLVKRSYAPARTVS